MTQQLVMMNAAIVVITIVAFLYFVGKDKLKRSGKWESEKRRKMHNRFVFYNNNVLLRKRFRRIVMRFSSLSCYSYDTVKVESVKLFERSLFISVLMPLTALIVVQDVSFAILVAFVGYIYYDIAVDKEIDKIYIQIIKEVSINIDSTRARYMETSSIPTAVLYSDKGKYLDSPMTAIYELLTAVNGKELLHEFCRTSPVRLIKTLAVTYFIVNETGDARKDDGQTVFTEELTALRQEADAQILHLDKTRIAFKSLSMLALLGLICTPLCEWFLLSQIPGTSLLLKGMYGMIARSIMVGVTILAYYVISVINRPSVVNQVDKIGWIDRLSKNKKVHDKVQNIIPKKFKTRQKIAGMIKDSLSSKDLTYIYLSKVIFSSIAFVATLLFLFIFVVTAKSYLYNNVNSLSFIPDQAMEESIYKRLKVLDAEYLALPEMPNAEDTTKMVKGKVRGLKELEYMKQAERLRMKYEQYHAMGYQWWFILLAYAAACVAWKGPEFSLLLRKKLVEYESAEDVMQLQTMMIVLSNTKMDVFKSLYWLERQSSIHKAPLRFAYHEFPSDPEGSLERLGASSSSNDFKRLVMKLKSAVYNLSLRDAFSDIVLDKEATLRQRTVLQEETLESKKQWAKLIAVAPTAIMLLAIFIGPIIILGVMELLRTFSQLGGGLPSIQ